MTHKPDSDALIGTARSWTWRQLDDDTSALANGYLALGMEPGDRIASLMPDDPVTVLHYLACVKAGLTITTIHYRSSGQFIDYVIGETGASALLYLAEREGELDHLNELGRIEQHLIRYGDPERTGSNLEDMLAAGSGDRVPQDLPQQANALVIFTSGSTGTPKGVTHTRDSLGWVIASLQKSHDLRDDDIYLGTSTLSFAVGVMYNLAVLAAGASAIVGRASDLDGVLALLRQRRPTIVFMVSPVCVSFFHHVKATHSDFESVRLFSVAGDKASKMVKDEFHGLTGSAIREAYGMTEIGSAIMMPKGATAEDALGRVAPGYELALRDKAGEILPAGQTGELTVRSKALTTGYWGRPDATAEVMQDGWLYSGDLMAFDDEGFVYFRGRSKQIILHDAVNISPQEVEESLLAHPAVTGAAAVGVLDHLHGENVWAYVSLDPDAPPPTESELIAFSQEQITWRAPEHVIVVATLPTTPVGKLDRTKVKEMARRYHAP